MHHRLAVIAAFLLIVIAAPPARAFCFGTIHVHVFNDINGNGVVDAGEAGRPGVVVQEDQTGDGTIESTLTTDVNGDADFFVPAVVVYRIRIITPGGATQTTVNPGDLNPGCNTTAPIVFGLVPTTPAMSPVPLALLALTLAAIVVIRRA
jgi:hypothetical protein